jgi:hypothetical protein
VADGFEQAAISAVAASQGKRLKQARHAMVLDRTIVAASLVAEGAGDPAFAEPGCPGDEQSVPTPKPAPTLPAPQATAKPQAKKPRVSSAPQPSPPVR